MVKLQKQQIGPKSVPPFRPLFRVANKEKLNFSPRARLISAGRNCCKRLLHFEMTLTDVSCFQDDKYPYQIPDLPDEYLEIKTIDNDEVETDEILQSYPLSINDLETGTILNAERLTNGDDVKEIYSFELSTKFTSFQPGDTIGIVTENREEDINKLFNHLGILSLSRRKIQVVEKSLLQKKNQSNLPYLNKVTTLNYLFKYCLDINCVPKKSLIRVLANYAKNEKERKCLEKLCSKEGSDLYRTFILETNKTFFDLILMFQTCCPPAVRLLENLPKLLPRPYSIASSPFASPNKIKIIFSVMKINGDHGKEGLCTGMLKNIIEKHQEKKFPVKFFFRRCNGFNLPSTEVPLILIGPGTGIAPFLGFLEHRKMQEAKGKIWLFHGCRYKTRDFLFEKELEEFLRCGVLSKLSVSFSRDNNDGPKYVQDNLKKHGKEVSNLIFNENAMIYVCGDARNMRSDVQNSFVEIFQCQKGMTNKEAVDFLKKLQKEKRYLQDIWT